MLEYFISRSRRDSLKYEYKVVARTTHWRLVCHCPFISKRPPGKGLRFLLSHTYIRQSTNIPPAFNLFKQFQPEEGCNEKEFVSWLTVSNPQGVSWILVTPDQRQTKQLVSTDTPHPHPPPGSMNVCCRR